MGEQKKIMICLGTRPEAIKLVSTIKELKENNYNVIVVNTEQHNKLTKQVLRIFNIKPDYSLGIMKTNQTLSYILYSISKKLDSIIRKEKPDMVIVQGDTTTSLSAALTAFNNKVPVFHIEAGVRSPDTMDPYPEEANRRLITQIASYNACQSEQHLYNLIFEKKVGIICGNPGIDALKMIDVNSSKDKNILITMHRRENWGIPIENICDAIAVLANNFKLFNFVISCHPNPVVKNTVYSKLNDIDNVKIIDALPFDKFVKEMSRSILVITDSGSVPQEAPAFGTPVLITRKVCENQEILDGGMAKLVGVEKDNIVKEVTTLLSNIEAYMKMMTGKIPYYDGTPASKKILSYVDYIFNSEVKK